MNTNNIYKEDLTIKNIQKNKILSTILCPNGLGCECQTNDDCINNKCLKHLRGSYCSLDIGDVFPEFIGIDQFGDTISIKDFAFDGKYILLEMGTAWCSPCRELAEWLSYNEDDFKLKNFWKNEYDIIYDLIHNNKIYFISVLYEDEFRNNATSETVYEWYSNYPDEIIPVIADENKYLHTIIKPTGIPAITLLNENLEIIELSTRGFNKAFDTLINILAKKEKDDK